MEDFIFNKTIKSMRLKKYEDAVKLVVKELQRDMRVMYIPKWYRLSITLLKKDALMISLYGIGERR